MSILLSDTTNVSMIMYLIVLLVMGIIAVAWKLYERNYYKSKNFINMRNRIETFIVNCNDLNNHIEDLKETYIGINQLDYGRAEYQDTSKYKYKRSELKKQKYAPNVYNCSRNVCDNARKQPFKYICKYFGIEENEKSLIRFEEVLNNFEAAEQGKKLLKREKESILNNISNDIPFLIKRFSKKRLERELGFKSVDFSTMYFPKYIFKYISSGGNASMNCDIVMDIDNLNRFVNYLAEKVKFKKSAAGQRALMTSSLRQKILQRDGYICQKCGNSTDKEPNLLLEIDHVIPISKGGLTTEENLQVLCWKCNRSKGQKILER